MKLAPLLQIGRGVTAIIGGGGKTTLMETLAEELSKKGKVIITTTTHIRRPARYETLLDADEAAVSAALDRSNIVCVGEAAENGKLCAPRLSMNALTHCADFVLVEADGAKRLPLKAHAPHEPVIPKEAGCVLCVVGARGFDRPIREAVHRPEQFCTLTGARPDEPASPALVARALAAEGFTQTIVLTGASEKQRSAFSAVALQYGLHIISI